MPAALLYLSAAIPFMYFSSLNADTTEGIPSTVCSTGRFGFVGIVPRRFDEQLMCDLVCIDQTRRVVEVGSLDNFLIVCHALRLLCVRSVNVMTSDPFFPFLFFHCVDQLCSSLQCTFAKRVA